MTLNRRVFMGTGAAAAASVLATPMVQAASHGRPKVVVVGGGAGGATAARYIAKDSKGEIDVTLVEPSRSYYTCFFSNLYIGGFRDLNSIAHSYGTLASEYGINVVHDWAVGIDRDARTVTLAGGSVLPYDRLVLSPGIDFVDGAVARVVHTRWSLHQTHIVALLAHTSGCPWLRIFLRTLTQLRKSSLQILNQSSLKWVCSKKAGRTTMKAWLTGSALTLAAVTLK